MSASTSARLGIAAVALSAGAVLAACGSSGSDSVKADATTSTTDAETTTTEAAETTTTTEAASTSTTLSDEGRDTETSELDTLPDGDYYGYIAGVENGVVEGTDVQVIIFDQAEMLTGQDAIDAAADDGVELDSDFYIRDPDASVISLAVVPDASVTSIDGGSPDPIPSSVTEVADQDFLFKINVSTVRDVTLVNSIEAVYLP